MTSNGSFYTDYNMTTLDMEVTRGLNCPEISEDHQYALGKMSFILEGKNDYLYTGKKSDKTTIGL